MDLDFSGRNAVWRKEEATTEEEGCCKSKAVREEAHTGLTAGQQGGESDTRRCSRERYYQRRSGDQSRRWGFRLNIRFGFVCPCFFFTCLFFDSTFLFTFTVILVSMISSVLRMILLFYITAGFIFDNMQTIDTRQYPWNWSLKEALLGQLCLWPLPFLEL